jgi:hypothetical protein
MTNVRVMTQYPFCIVRNLSERLTELANDVHTQTSVNTAVISKYSGIYVVNTLLRGALHM